MATLVFAASLRRHVDAPAAQLDGATLRAVLDAYFAAHPSVKSYVLDDQGAVRKHVAIFRNGTLIGDRAGLTDPVREADEIYVVQALSGG
ncbi:MAG TPA: MoaD/ThiS family protein [Pelomicrobium sp.]|nr:MoaD/ThiS family protein [Pelomicrobium sp.]